MFVEALGIELAALGAQSPRRPAPHQYSKFSGQMFPPRAQRLLVMRGESVVLLLPLTGRY